MHAVKVDSRKIMAAGLVIVAVFAAVAITVNLFYLERIQAAAASWVEMKSFTWSRASCGVTSAMKWARLFTEFWSEARHSSR